MLALRNTSFMGETGVVDARTLPRMNVGAHNPEELEALLEDAFVIADGDALVSLFEDGAVLAGAEEVARGPVEIRELAASMCTRRLTYLAEPRQVVQTRDTALVVGRRAINVVRRGHDGAWRYTIALLSPEEPKEAR